MRNHFQFRVKSFERVKGKGVKIRGLASTPDIDRDMDVVVPNAFAKSIEKYKKLKSAPALLRSHHEDSVVGKILMDGADAPVINDSGLIITALVTEKETADLVAGGELHTLSIGYIPQKTKFEMRGTGKFHPESGQELLVEVRILEELDWVETSIVSTPANQGAIFTVQKSLSKYFKSLPSPAMEHKCSVYPDQTAAYKIGDRWLSQKAVDEMQWKGDKPLTIEEIEAKEFKTEAEADAFAEEKEVGEYMVEEKDGAFSIKLADDEESEDEDGDDEDEENEDEGEDEDKEEDEEEEDDENDDNSESESTEKSGESPDGSEDEESEDEGADDGEKITVSKEQKDTITNVLSLITAVDQKTTVKKAKKTVKKAMKQMPSEGVALDIVLPLMVKMAETIKNQDDQIGKLTATVKKIPSLKGKSLVALSQSGAIVDAKQTDETEEKKDASLVNWLKSAKSSNKAIVFGGDEDEE